MIFKKTEAHTRAGGTLNLLICGAQRSGTTSLVHYLEEHPEIGFLNDADLRLGNAYIGYPFASPVIAHSIIGEDPKTYQAIAARLVREKKTIIAAKQPYFMVFPHVPFNVREHLPDVKLIFILRNPIDAAYSAYRNGLGKGRREGSFEDNLRMDEAEAKEISHHENRSRWYGYFKNPENVPLLVDRGFYYQQIIRFYRCFKEEQILVLRFDQLVGNTAETMQRILKFLGLDPQFRFTRIGTVMNASPNVAPMSPKTRTRLQEIYSESNRKLFAFLGWPASLWE